MARAIVIGGEISHLGKVVEMIEERPVETDHGVVVQAILTDPPLHKEDGSEIWWLPQHLSPLPPPAHVRDDFSDDADIVAYRMIKESR